MKTGEYRWNFKRLVVLLVFLITAFLTVSWLSASWAPTEDVDVELNGEGDEWLAEMVSVDSDEAFKTVVSKSVIAAPNVVPDVQQPPVVPAAVVPAAAVAVAPKPAVPAPAPVQFTPEEKELLTVKGNPNIIFYNRVPKCASKTVRLTFHDLANMNGFNAFSSEIFNIQTINEVEQENLAREIYDMQKPLTYDRHIHFVDFTRFGLLQPIYLNVVRDPISRFVSSYHYLRYRCTKLVATCPSTFDLKTDLNRTIDECVQSDHHECLVLFHIIPYFCGQAKECKSGNTRAIALQKAKENVVKYFTVVGYSEELDQFFYAIEKLMPRYFGNVTAMLGRKERHENTYKADFKIPPSEKSMQILKSRMKEEYDFYEFIKQRFYVQYMALSKL